MGTDKGLVIHEGKKLIQHVIDACSPVCHNLHIVTSNADYDQFKLPIIADEQKNCGPLGGVAAALNHTYSDFNLIVSCDMPYITSELLHQLVAHCTTASCCVSQGHLQPLPLVIHRKYCNTAIEQLRLGEYSLIEFLNKTDTDVLMVEEMPASRMFENINRPEQLR